MGTNTVNEFLQEFADDRDYIVAHTSGSTGKPKEIKLPKADMRASALATCRYFDITAGSLIAAPLSVNYIAGKMMLVRGIVSGCRVVMLQPSNRPDLAALDRPADLLAVVPSQVDYIIDNHAGKVRNLLIGGSALPEEIERRLVTAPFASYVSYGMTETCSHVALRRIGESGSLYHAMPGISFESDDRGRLVIVAPDRSFRRLVTNDIVSIQDPFSFRWLGRADNVINTGGIKVFAEEIERKLSAFISQPLYVSGRPDAKWGTRVVLHVEGQPRPDIEQVCRENLDRYEMPREIIFDSRFERTGSGKIIRNS